MISIDLETWEWKIHTEELLCDGELHLGAGLDGAGEADGGGDGDGGPGVQLQGVRQHRQLIYASWLGGSLCCQKNIF